MSLSSCQVARLTRNRQHNARCWFGAVERTRTIGRANFMSKIFNE